MILIWIKNQLVSESNTNTVQIPLVPQMITKNGK